MQNKSPNKPLKVWLYVILSLLPIAGIYPLIKLKKARRMFLIDGLVLVGAYITSFGLLEFGLTFKTGALLPIYSAILFLYIGDAICVYFWVKEYNKKLMF